MSLLSPFLCVYFLLLHGALIFELALLQLPIFSKSTYIFPPGLLRKKRLVYSFHIYLFALLANRAKYHASK